MSKNDFFFRIWDNENNGYLGRDYDCNLSVSSVVDEFDFGILRIKHKDNNPFMTPEVVEVDWNIELYTGLKDKNGIKIYVGDIVKFPNLGDGLENNYEIKFVDFGFRMENSIYGEIHSLKYIEQHELDKIEVIGNVHQNMDLLPQKRNDDNFKNIRRK